MMGIFQKIRNMAATKRQDRTPGDSNLLQNKPKLKNQQCPQCQATTKRLAHGRQDSSADARKLSPISSSVPPIQGAIRDGKLMSSKTNGALVARGQRRRGIPVPLDVKSMSMSTPSMCLVSSEDHRASHTAPNSKSVKGRVGTVTTKRQPRSWSRSKRLASQLRQYKIYFALSRLHKKDEELVFTDAEGFSKVPIENALAGWYGEQSRRAYADIPMDDVDEDSNSQECDAGPMGLH